MRCLGMLVYILFLSSPVLAGMTPEERCEEQGVVAEKASTLRISGDDKETAISTLTKEYDHSGTSITAQNIRGLVTVSYMAKMKPAKMRDYAIAQCRKDISK